MKCWTNTFGAFHCVIRGNLMHLSFKEKVGKRTAVHIQVHFVLRHCFHRKCIIIFSRYEDQNRDNSGIQTSYAYDVEGQKVQVARLDPVYYNKY